MPNEEGGEEGGTAEQAKEESSPANPDPDGGEKPPKDHINRTSRIKEIHNSIKDSPNYPENFKDIQNGTKRV
ncbi:MAG: hypothetical protein HC877_05450 [Thioploca sp.]|nr:hypothetical protein [Thioploca sp.]